MVERVLCMHEVPGSMPGSSNFFFLFQDCISGVKKFFRSHRNWIGGLAYMVERVLCMHEAPGSMRRSSSFFFFFKIVLVGSRSCSQVIVTGSGD